MMGCARPTSDWSVSRSRAGEQQNSGDFVEISADPRLTLPGENVVALENPVFQLIDINQGEQLIARFRRR